MSRTNTHTIEGKCRNKIIEWSDAPENCKKKWSRRNFEVGYFRNLRNKKRYENIT